MSEPRKFKPMERDDINHIKELLGKMLVIDANAFKEIYNHMAELLISHNKE